MVMVYCELLHQNCLSLLKILGWLFDMNLAIIYIPTNLFINKNSQNYCHFYVRQLNIRIFWAIKKIFFVKLIYHKQHYIRRIIVRFEQFSPSRKNFITTLTPWNAQFQFCNFNCITMNMFTFNRPNAF